MQQYCGWIDNPKAVDSVLATLPYPVFADRQLVTDTPKQDIVLSTYVRKVLNGADAPKGPQAIGDCVSWGWSGLVDYVECLQIYKQLTSGMITQAEAQAWLEGYEETSSEAVYAAARVNIGGQKGSYSDGAVGAWAAKAVNTIGTISRKVIGPYSGQRAKSMGASGLTSEQITLANTHMIKTVSQVSTFEAAAALIGNGYPIAVCSDQGFTMTRDKDGFCTPQGSWNHCMLLMGARYGSRQGLCCAQSWGPNTPSGPTALDQPDNTFWIDADVVNRMLGQGDSFTGSEFDGYKIQQLLDWKF